LIANIQHPLLSQAGRYVERFMAQPYLVQMDDYFMRREGFKYGLKVGRGFWNFDIADEDLGAELSLLDKLILWPRVKALRAKLKFGED